MIGSGRQHGPLRPDYGDDWADLRCDACGATWTGVINEPCGWCADALERILRQQAELVVRPPDVDAGDITYAAAMKAWGARMAHAVRSGIITKKQADNAWRRARHGAASQSTAA